jgi:hypothetical protein
MARARGRTRCAEATESVERRVCDQVLDRRRSHPVPAPLPSPSTLPRIKFHYTRRRWHARVGPPSGPRWRCDGGSFRRRFASAEESAHRCPCLVALHRLASFDWPARFGLIRPGSPSAKAAVASRASADAALEPSAPRRVSGHHCAKCGDAVSFTVVKFCWNSRERFRGDVYCIGCQSSFPATARRSRAGDPGHA